ARKKQKERFQGEFFPASWPTDSARIFLDFFQTDRHTGKPKGILRLQLRRNS
ncbi:MAG: DUF6932 family protein, partial [Planctomycetota bacterium]